MVIKLVKIREYEMGLYFHDRAFRGLLEPGRRHSRHHPAGRDEGPA
jgi:hypothetical protein